MSERTNFGKMIAIERVKQDITLTDLANKLGVSPTYVTNIERGHKILSVDRAAKLLNVLNIEDEKAYWVAYYAERKTVPIHNIDEQKRLTIIELLVTDLNETDFQHIKEYINECHTRRY